MFRTPHELTPGEKKCLEAYEREKSKEPRKNLIKLVRHVNMFNPVPGPDSWEYIFFDRQLSVTRIPSRNWPNWRVSPSRKRPGRRMTSAISDFWSIATVPAKRTRSSFRSLPRVPWRARS